MQFDGKGLEEVIISSGIHLLNNGIKSYPRGKEILELLNVSLCIRDPEERLAYFEGRGKGFNLCHAIVESLMLVSDKDELKYFSKFNENMKNFSDDSITLHGAYGRRISEEGFPYIIEKLKDDKDSRQAVLNIYSHERDSESTKDVPCTETLQFLIRNEKLHLIVNMRSNDIIWGLPYDVFMFTSIQQVIANSLGVGLGSYFHNAGSFHVYKEFYDVLDNMVDKNSEGIVCDALRGVSYEQYANMSLSYTNAIKKDDWDFCLSLGEPAGKKYLMVLKKENEYRRMLEAKKEMNNIKLENVGWVNRFTKRWYE